MLRLYCDASACVASAKLLEGPGRADVDATDREARLRGVDRRPAVGGVHAGGREQQRDQGDDGPVPAGRGERADCRGEGRAIRLWRMLRLR